MTATKTRALTLRMKDAGFPLAACKLAFALSKDGCSGDDAYAAGCTLGSYGVELRLLSNTGFGMEECDGYNEEPQIVAFEGSTLTLGWL